MHHMRALYWIPLLALAACASSKSGTDTSEDAPPESAPFTVLEASMDGDSLRTVLQFGGGFREHAFSLEAVGAATKSLPRQQSIRILHDADGDMGKALLTERHAFDLRLFRDPSQSSLILRLEGWNEGLKYNYTP